MEVSTALQRHRGEDDLLREIQSLSREAGLHPDVVRRLFALGLLEIPSAGAGTPGFARDAPARLARAVRLRRDLGLNYAGAILACELLERIDRLEAQLRRYQAFEFEARSGCKPDD
jgi:hypothetical protein